MGAYLMARRGMSFEEAYHYTAQCRAIDVHPIYQKELRELPPGWPDMAVAPNQTEAAAKMPSSGHVQYIAALKPHGNCCTIL